jgi:predicted  nucleic acid-binding Zn-ribbon protein
MSRVSALFRLQEIDLDLDACRAQLAEIDRALSGSPAVQAARSRLLSAESRQKGARVVLQEIELETGSISDKIREAEQRLYGGSVRNPKELQDLQADVESLKRRLAAAEERQLNALIESEVAETEAAGLRTELEQAETAAAREHNALHSQHEFIRARQDKLQVEREAAVAPVPAADRQLYERLRQTKHGRALAQLADGSCAACGIAPSSQVRQEARRGADLVRCPGCDRILYGE